MMNSSVSSNCWRWSFSLLFVLLLLLQPSNAFPSPGRVFGLLQMNDRIRPIPLSSYAALPLEEHWMFVRPAQRRFAADRIAPSSHLWHKRAVMRLGKRAMMRLGKRR